MNAPAKRLARKEPAASVALLAGPELVRLLPRHWTGRLVERCRVCDRVVQDSVHARLNGKYQLQVHYAAVLLALEHQRHGLRGLMSAVAHVLTEPGSHLLTDEPAKVGEGAMYAGANIGV